jgi:MFS family permease
MFFVALVFLPTPSIDRRSGGTCTAIIPALKSLAGNRPLFACLVATLGGCLGFGMFVTFMPLYIRSQGMNTGQVGLVFAAQALANALSRLPSGRLSDRLEDRRVLVMGGMVVFAMALAAFGLCRSIVPLMATAAMMGISMGVAFTVICALIVDVVPLEMRGLAMGCYSTCVYAGMMLSSVCMGPVIRAEGFSVGFFLNGVAVAIVLVLFIFLYRRQDTAG